MYYYVPYIKYTAHNSTDEAVQYTSEYRFH